MAVVVAVALCVAACTSGDDSGAAQTTAPTTKAGAAPSDGKVRFGGFNFSESTILANIYAQAAIAAGVPAEVVPNIGPRELVYEKLFKGDLDAVPEYSGTAVVALGGEAEADKAATHDTLVDLMKAKDVGVLDSADAVDRNAIAVTLDTATRLHLQTMS